MKITNEKEYEGLLKVAKALIEIDPPVGTKEAEYLNCLVDKIQNHETKLFGK